MTESLTTVSLADAARPLFAGVDVGGTYIKFGVVDDQGRPLGSDSIPTEEPAGPGDAMRRAHAGLTALCNRLGVAWGDVAAVGLGSPGSMDIPRGMILEPPNMPTWRYFPLRDCLADRCGKPVAFANDANAAAFGEFWVGSGRQFRSLAMFTLGTGVGGGIILDGKSIDGVNSFGSELGHLVIDCRPDARLCVWGGGQGQLEAYACAPAVVARTQELLAAGRASSLTARIAAGDKFSTRLLADEAERGDALAIEVILDTAYYLAAGVVSVVHAVDPGAVILGGAMTFGGHATSIGRRFLATVREQFHRRAYHVVADQTYIDFGLLGGSAGYIGAAGLARALATA